MTADRPLTGRRVAITRPELGDLGDRLVELGADVVHVPLIEIADPADGGVALRQALQRLSAFDWLVVTSVNGAARVGPVAAHPNVRLAAVGPATARTLSETAGRVADLVASVPRVDGLLAEFPRGAARVLVVQADRAGPGLVDGLASVGHQVEAVVAYRTVLRRPDDSERAALADVDAVVFASGSAATSWVEAIGSTGPGVMVAVGPATASVAQSRGLTVTHVARSPDAATVAELVAHAFRPPH